MMKAIVHTKFGPPEVLQIREVDKPKPKDNEVLIRIYATTVATEDPGFRKSSGINGIFKPAKQILGFYLAGEIEEIGIEVKLFKKGDKVFGSPGMSMGAYAEYKCMPEDGALALKPKNLSFEEAAAIPNGALTSLPFLRDKANIKKGQTILINGASGTVGTSAIQFAKYFGAEVTGVCSTKNLEMVKSLGADHVIDYTSIDFTRTGQTWDIIFDAVGKSSFSHCKSVLNEKGVYLTTTPKLSSFLTSLLSPGSSKKVKFAATGLRKATNKAKDLRFIKELVETGVIKPVIDCIYPMDQIVEAHRYVEKGHKKGDVVIKIQD